MSSSLRRGTLAATAIALAVVSLSACGTGNNAQTLQIKPDSAATAVDDIQIQAVNFIVPKGGEGPATLTARIFNSDSEPQQLKDIRVGNTGLKVELSPAKGEQKLTVPAHGHLAIGGKGNASAVIAEADRKLQPGEAQRVSFDLSSTGKIEMRATVVLATADNYREFGPSAAPTPSEAPTESTPESPGAEGEQTEGEQTEGEQTEGATTPEATETGPANTQQPTGSPTQSPQD
ncbi:hypothetical protein [Streptomyces oceani]|uniref:DUF461 domain-containing protein n=1 Tax=Streptomyces oceani TaxID=1075402 RepID=A0A1E7KLS6_9ACTN|nr:hypothetical protein [Streptomyces oceani]OEV04982.1 hypothetical protein AN216_05105 [Streptomyces oceani]